MVLTFYSGFSLDPRFKSKAPFTCEGENSNICDGQAPIVTWGGPETSLHIINILQS